jgi:creatinine amidohydrolase
LDALKPLVTSGRIVLPVCSLGTPAEDLAALGGLILPPLYHEALAYDSGLKGEVIAQIRRCFPFFEGTRARAGFHGRVDVVELPVRPPCWAGERPVVLAVGADTTIEQHGPHLPLATDTIQTYAVLRQLAAEFGEVHVGPPLDYGHLTWGLPFGMSVDLTPALLRRYALGFFNALVAWCEPEALYVADVHGSLVHRATLAAALRACGGARGAFRFLHDPLEEFGARSGDMHAGGLETVLVAHISPALVDPQCWPRESEGLCRGQMTVADATALSADLPAFIARVEAGRHNGIIGRLEQAGRLDAAALFARMVQVARADVASLRR